MPRGTQTIHTTWRGQSHRAVPREGTQSRYSGLRVQGTASSPPSTTILKDTLFPARLTTEGESV
ncbi:hypothetical protein NITHO_200003 [Nitrolancea hollandica Lb]|uniref:Uncharacterized protein n=1 Tax=Nitrolancea hollandica Lb TaxID=1129897 RepID=I4EES2_9BACT|nr:hypothetical protein NITHO_200003 [Nitrolancea hollandica Lb]